MKPLLMSAVVALSTVSGAFAQSLDEPDSVPLDVSTAGAYFVDRDPEDAWDGVQRTLEAMGLDIDQRDADHQVILTVWRVLGSSELSGGPTLLFSADARFRVRFEVFVSPFADPTRVYVGSLIEVERESQTTLIYNYPPVNEALLSKLADGIGGRAGSIGENRDVLASGVPDACQSDDGIGLLAVTPQVIPLSNHQVMLPASDPGRPGSQAIRIEYRIFDDGSVGDLRVPDTAAGSELVTAAAGALSMRFYAPGRLGNGCAVPVSTSLVVDFPN